MCHWGQHEVDRLEKRGRYPLTRWLSSDYMLAQLALDPATTRKSGKRGRSHMDSQPGKKPASDTSSILRPGVALKRRSTGDLQATLPKHRMCTASYAELPEEARPACLAGQIACRASDTRGS